MTLTAKGDPERVELQKVKRGGVRGGGEESGGGGGGGRGAGE